ncbi:MAG: hypothetical protein ACREMB_17420 [Candidatus Rokuibacteriota bacterium]
MTAIAILYADLHVTGRLQSVLEDAGFETEAARLAEIRDGELDLLAFFEEHDPDLVLYEVSPPYPQSLTFMRLLQNLPGARHRPWMLMATDPAAVIELLGPTDALLPLPAGPDEAADVVQAVRRQLAPPSPRRTEAA